VVSGQSPRVAPAQTKYRNNLFLCRCCLFPKGTCLKSGNQCQYRRRNSAHPQVPRIPDTHSSRLRAGDHHLPDGSPAIRRPFQPSPLGGRRQRTPVIRTGSRADRSKAGDQDKEVR